MLVPVHSALRAILAWAGFLTPLPRRLKRYRLLQPTGGCNPNAATIKLPSCSSALGAPGSGGGRRAWFVGQRPMCMIFRLLVLIAAGLIIVTGGCSSAPHCAGVKWQYGIYTERADEKGELYEWEAKGGSISAARKTAVLRHLGYNVSDKADPPIVTLLDHLASQGWTLMEVVSEPDKKRCRYIFRKLVAKTPE